MITALKMPGKPLRRVFYYLTTSEHKVAEARRSIEPYGITVEQLIPEGDEEEVDRLVDQKAQSSDPKERFIVMGVIREQTILVNELTGNSAEMTHLEPVIHKSRLMVRKWFSIDCMFSDFEFDAQTRGFIDLARRTEADHKYNWDDIFVVQACQKSYLELADRYRKISPRDKNIDTMLEKLVHYKEPVDLAHRPQGYKECIDFDRTLAEYIAAIEEFHTPFMQRSGLGNILTNAMNQGAAFKAPTTRLQKLYWCPGLNAFIPLTPKPKDPRHELTFQFHDFSHFNMPDLVFDGVVTPLHKLVYIVYRLISESSTLVFADMMFVYSMVQSGLVYDTVQQRKIYPVFEEMVKKNPEFHKDLAPFMHDLLQGSYEHCFYGDNTRWSSMMDSDKPLEQFGGKYDKYFMEDFRWTRHNWDYMAAHAEIYSAWWYRIQGWRQYGHNLELQSVSEFIAEFGLGKLTDPRNIMDAVFAAVYSKFWARIVQGQKMEAYTEEQRQQNRFVRYMMGQSIIFFQTPHWKSSRYADSIEGALKRASDKGIGPTLIRNTRAHYNRFLDDLLADHLISGDERANYAQICPIFGACIVDYDHGEFETPIAEYVRQILELDS